MQLAARGELLQAGVVEEYMDIVEQVKAVVSAQLDVDQAEI